MPCDTRVQPGQTAEQRRKQTQTALEKLEKALSLGSVKVVVGPQGAVAFKGWSDGRDGVTDVCAFRRLRASSSSALRMALAKAEGLAGRKADPKAIAAGTHSHDGGGGWHDGH